jgi:hypothetical protein
MVEAFFNQLALPEKSGSSFRGNRTLSTGASSGSGCHRLGSERSDLIGHLSPLLLMMFLREEGRRSARLVVLSLQTRLQHGNRTIVLLILFLVGGGGWGYSRWRG